MPPGDRADPWSSAVHSGRECCDTPVQTRRKYVRPSPARVAAVLGGAAGLALTVAIAGGPAQAVPSTALVINEAYGGGGNTSAPFTNDFIELRNGGTADADLTGWSV